MTMFWVFNIERNILVFPSGYFFYVDSFAAFEVKRRSNFDLSFKVA